MIFPKGSLLLERFLICSLERKSVYQISNEEVSVTTIIIQEVTWLVGKAAICFESEPCGALYLKYLKSSVFPTGTGGSSLMLRFLKSSQEGWVRVTLFRCDLKNISAFKILEWKKD